MFTPITIDKLILEFYKDENLEDFVALFTNEELCKHMAGGAYDKIRDAENLFHFFQKTSLAENSNQKAYGIFVEGELIGHFETAQKGNEIEIVYLLKKKFWGKGITKKIIEYFNKQLSETIVARVLPNNTNSTKMLEKFALESKKISTFNGEKVLKYALKKKANLT